LQVDSLGTRRSYTLHWRYPSAAQSASHRNEEEATRDGAYAVALGTAGSELRLVTIGRAASRTGTDWYLVDLGTDDSFDLDREGVTRLEVSGISSDTPSNVRERVRVKTVQAEAGRSDFPAMVGIVGFRTPLVVLRKVGT
jgi:hypothetical protein